MSTFIRALQRKFVDLLHRTGFSELVGGRDALESGFDDLMAGAVPVVAELLQIHDRREGLAEAVLDGERYPHLARVHGWFVDIMTMEVPQELIPWARRGLRCGPALDDKDFHRLLATLAFRSPSPAERAVGRIIFFEVLCLTQRMRLLAAGVQIEVIGGREEDVEGIAEEELEQVEARQDYRNALLSLDDPLGSLRVLLGTSVARLDAYVEILRQEVARVGREVAERLRVRQEMLRLLASADPADALLIRNAHAEAFGGERLTIEQLRLRHPGHLGDLSPAAARKRLERALRRPHDPAVAKAATFGELLLEQMRELEG